jgi:HK97 family phage portal protein
MSEKKKTAGLSLKAIYFSIRDALAYRQLDRDPGNRDVTRGDYHSAGESTPRIDRALQLSTIWSCVRLISGTISTQPLFLYERTVTDGRDTRRIAREHSLYYLLHDSPNADMTAVEFWECVTVGLLTWGNSYVLKSYSGSRIVALDPLNPALMTVRRTLDGDVTYVYADPRGQKEYTEREIWHIKGFGSDGLIGYSPIGMGWRSVMSASNVENASAKTFGGGIKPSGVVTVKDILTKEQRKQIQESMIDAVFGNNEIGRQFLMEGGATYQQLTINPVDAQMVETLSRSVEDLCRWYQVPPSMIGHGTAVSNWGTGREQINLGFKQYVLDPYLTRIEQSIAKHLLTAAERKKYYAEFNLDSLLRADSGGRATMYREMITTGVYTPNFCRSLENLEPLEGGDQLFMQGAMVPITKLGQNTSTQQTDTIPQENDAVEEENNESAN